MDGKAEESEKEVMGNSTFDSEENGQNDFIEALKRLVCKKPAKKKVDLPLKGRVFDRIRGLFCRVFGVEWRTPRNP